MHAMKTTGDYTNRSYERGMKEECKPLESDIIENALDKTSLRLVFKFPIR